MSNGVSGSDTALCIGGVHVRVRSPLTLAHYPADFYAPFLSSGGDCPGCTSSLDIELLVEEPPTSDDEVLFDTGASWFLQRGQDGYCINIRRGMDTGDVVSAVCDANTSNVVIYIGDEARLCEGGAPGAEYDIPATPVSYPLDQLLMMNHLVSRRGVVVHGAAAVVDGQALVFPGVSQAGKSTVARLFAAAGLKEALLSDDRVILRARLEESKSECAGETGSEDPGVTVWGTPWAGDAREARNAAAPLGGLFFLHQDTVNKIEPVDAATALRLFAPVASVPWYDASAVERVLDTCGEVIANAPCYELHFRPEQDVVEMLTGGSWR